MEKKNNNILLLGIKEDNLIYLTYQIDFKTYNEIRTKMLIAEQQNHEHGPLCSAYITFTRLHFLITHLSQIYTIKVIMYTRELVQPVSSMYIRV